MRRKILAIILWTALSVGMIATWYISFSTMGYKTKTYINKRIAQSNAEGSDVLIYMVSVEMNDPQKNFEIYGTVLGVSVVLYVPLTIGCYTLGWKRKEDKHDD